MTAWLVGAATGWPLLALAPVVVYFADTGWTLQRRLRRDGVRSAFTAHREHTYRSSLTSGVTSRRPPSPRCARSWSA